MWNAVYCWLQHFYTGNISSARLFIITTLYEPRTLQSFQLGDAWEHRKRERVVAYHENKSRLLVSWPRHFMVSLALIFNILLLHKSHYTDTSFKMILHKFEHYYEFFNFIWTLCITCISPWSASKLSRFASHSLQITWNAYRPTQLPVIMHC
jgi:hypothetical protein